MAQHAPSYAHDPPADMAGQIRVRGTRDGLLLSVPDCPGRPAARGGGGVGRAP